MLRLLLQDEPLARQLDLRAVAAATDGYSGSDLDQLCKTAAMYAVEEALEAEEAAEKAAAEGRKAAAKKAAAAAERGSAGNAAGAAAADAAAP